MNTEFETVLTGLREQKDRNLPEGLRGEVGYGMNMEKPQTMPSVATATGPRMRGVVKWFNPTKGFGFITPDNGGLDVFVHQSEIQLPGFRSLAQGEPVEYQLYDGQKGPKALKVTGPQGTQVKGAPRQTKPKTEKATLTDNNNQVPSNFIKLASNYIQVPNHVPVSTPVLAPQISHALPSMISTPTAASPQISHYYIAAQPGLQQNYYAPSDFSSFADLSGMQTMPMSPTPMMYENSPHWSPMSPQPQYMNIPFTQYATATTPTPFTFPNSIPQNNVLASPPQMPQTTFDYSNTYNSMSFEETGPTAMQISSPIHCG